MIIPIAVNDKIASLCGGRRYIVCDNSDYIVSFEFDSTWEKYYTQNGALYLCNRDTVNPVYHALADLVGIYVEVVS